MLGGPPAIHKNKGGRPGTTVCSGIFMVAGSATIETLSEVPLLIWNLRFQGIRPYAPGRLDLGFDVWPQGGFHGSKVALVYLQYCSGGLPKSFKCHCCI